MKMKKKGLMTLILQYGIAAVIGGVLIAGTSVAFYYDTEINTVLAPPIVDTEKYKVTNVEGQKLSAQIVEEGSVLLRNENHTLPLSKEKNGKVNVFGWHSVDWLYSPGGDSVSSAGGIPEDDDFAKNIDLLKALDNYGIQYNTELSTMYERYFAPFKLARGLKAGSMSEAKQLVEPSIKDKAYYTDSLLSNAKAFSDTAIVVLSRLCGEGDGASCSMTEQKKAGPNGVSSDNTRHYLEITTEEEELLTYVGANYDKVIVLLNTSNAFEMGFLETIPGLDAALNVGYTGTRGASALPKLLYGEISPSGKLADTFAYDLLSLPSTIWTGQKYSDNGTYHLDKAEGIYIGYKWFETADAMGLWTPENGYADGYKGVVQYPFGYGLSYTSFDWTVDDIKVDGKSVETGTPLQKDSKIEFTVSVKNTGSIPGRDVVEIFGTAPYTPGGIEKSAVELLGYNKTNVIQPQASETITVAVDMYDIASYDCYDKNNDGIKGYELDAGTYSFKLQTDSHTINDVHYKNESIQGKFDFILPETQYIDKDPVTGQTVKNLFTGDDAVDIVPIDDRTSTYDPQIPWLTRSDFKTPAEQKELHKTLRSIDPVLSTYDMTSMEAWNAWDEATTDIYGKPVNQTLPTWGASTTKKLAENDALTDLGKKLGENYDDPEWESVLNQVTFDEALNLFNRYYGSAPVDSVGKPRISDLDGPLQIKGYNATTPRGTGYPSITVLGQTFNPSLAYKFGQSFGNEMKSVGVVGLWGFACDLHISPFFGRNNESPSEDPYLAGTTIALATKGVNSRGRVTYTKHFATFQGYYKQTFMTEQAFRETNLKAYRKVFVDGQSLGAMTSYQSVGSQQSNLSQGLITGVLRGEWAFKGSITTDASSGNDYYLEGLIRCGGNYGMNISLGVSGKTYSPSTASARLQNRMREAVHQVLYTWLRADYNERMYTATAKDDESYVSSVSINSWVWWKPFLISLDVVVACVIVFWLTWATTAFLRKNTERHDALVEDLDQGDDGRKGGISV